MVVANLLPRSCWWQQIGWSYCAASWSWTFSLVAWCNTKEKGHFVRNTLSCSWCNLVRWGVTAAMPMVGGLTLALPILIFFFSLVFSRLHFGVTFRD